MKENKLLKVVFWGIFLFYLFLLMEVVLLRGYSARSVNFVPLIGMMESINVDDGIRYKLVDVSIWGNIIMFIPAGIYIMTLMKGDSKLRGFLYILAISILVEVAQYVFSLGASDIDDVILNGMGGGIGIACFSLLMKLFATKQKVKKVISVISAVVGIPILIIAVLVVYVNY